MTLASDQKIGGNGLSQTAQRMLDLRDEVLERWQSRVREEVTEASHLPHPILMNSFPVLYDNLAQAVTIGYPRKSATDGNTVATEHGGERARLTAYGPQSVIAEYQILRWTILDTLQERGITLNRSEFSSLNWSLDFAIRESVATFVVTQSQFRQQMVAAVSHDLRTPLGTASLLSELLLIHASEPDKVRELTAKLQEHLGRMDSMIKQFLNSASVMCGQRLTLSPSNFDLLTLANEVKDQLLLPRLEIVGAPVHVFWDRDAVKRVLENLISNAVKYGDPNAPIRIKVNEYHERGIVSVHNEGKPIPADELPSVFKAFKRTSAATSSNQVGWGIGLPYARTVAESHGGSMVVDSADGRGTTFAFDLPLDCRPYLEAPVI